MKVVFYVIYSLAICINIKAFNQINRKQLNILKTFLEYLEFYIHAYWRRFSLKSGLTNYIPRARRFNLVLFSYRQSYFWTPETCLITYVSIIIYLKFVTIFLPMKPLIRKFQILIHINDFRIGICFLLVTLFEKKVIL